VIEGGAYRVVGQRRYRGHQPGDLFEAKLDQRAEARAIGRGDIELVERKSLTVQPGSFVFPEGWTGQQEARTDEQATSTY
jgi:hypothetical protein